MPKSEPLAPLAVYMLADHLDAALAAGEDLVARGQSLRQLAEAQLTDPSSDILPAQRDCAEAVRGFELILIARVLQARDYAKALAQADARFTAVANLFVGGTAQLLDAVEECGDARGEDFDTGDDIISYIRARGLIAPDAAGILHPAQWTIDDSFMVAKRIMLGPLLDMAASFLDALDTQYELFAEDEDQLDDKPAPSRREFGKRERAPLN